MISLSGLYSYPIKSCAGNAHTSSAVALTGLVGDRRFAWVDLHDRVLTAREFPRLLSVSVQVLDQELVLHFDGVEARFDLPQVVTEKRMIQFFTELVCVRESSLAAGNWMSEILGEPCRLVMIDTAPGRSVLERRGGVAGDRMALADECPLLVVSEASLQDLDTRIGPRNGKVLELRQFRPNLVLSNCEPWQEDTLRFFRLGEVDFEVLQPCRRCVLATINPDSLEKDPQQEPLRTLATFRQTAEGRVTFGVHAIPRSTGTIELGMTLAEH